MMGDLIRVIEDAGATLRHDFFHYLITRHNPHDQPQAQIAAMLRHLFADEVLMPTAIESTAVEAAGLGKRSLYEMEPRRDRARYISARKRVDGCGQYCNC